MTKQMVSRRRFEDLYDAFGSAILAYAARRTASAQDAADVMADTFTVVWRRIDDVPDGDGARPWVFGVARGVLANHRRGLNRRERLSERVATQLATAVTPGFDGDDPLGGRRRGFGGDWYADDAGDSNVRRALRSLDETDQELLTLLAWEELTRSEVAQIVGCSPAALRVRLSRARSRFRAALERLEGTPLTSGEDRLRDRAVPTTSKEL